MKANHYLASKYLYFSMSFLVLLSLLLGGCGTPTPAEPATEAESVAVEEESPTEAPPPTATQSPPTEIPPTATPTITLADIAEEIAAEVGAVTEVVENEGQPVIFVFEERHDSVLGQIEMAIMLNRLYTEHGLRHIGLEGHMADEEPLDLSWSHEEPYFSPDQPITGHQDVLVQMTQEGEFTAVELIGLLYHDTTIADIDAAELYAFDPPDEAWDAPDFYLYYIALAGMSDAEHTAWQALYDNEQYDEAFDFALGSDEFTAEMYAKLSDPVNIVSAEAWLTALDEIQTLAEAVEVDLTEADIANLEAMVDYFDHVSQRSDAMVAHVLELAASSPEVPIAINIGALHTERVAELLTDAGVSFVVIRPASLAEGEMAGLLSSEAYQRKQEGLSVAPHGWLGSFLDGRKKPGPTADKVRSQYEEQLRELLQEIAEYAALLKYTHDLSEEEILSELNNNLRMSMGESGFQIPAEVKVADVLPGTEDNPHPQVVIAMTFDVNLPLIPGKTLEMTVQLKENGEEKTGLHVIEERLKEARDDLHIESISEKTNERFNVLSQPICSNTEVTKITETGG